MIDLILKLFWWIAIPGAFCLGLVVASLLIANRHLECVTCEDRKKIMLKELLRELDE